VSNISRNFNLWSRNHWRMLLHPCNASSLAFRAQVTFICTGSTFSSPQKKFLIPHRTHLTPSSTHIRPAIAGIRNPLRPLVRISTLIFNMCLSPSRLATRKGQMANHPTKNVFFKNMFISHVQQVTIILYLLPEHFS